MICNLSAWQPICTYDWLPSMIIIYNLPRWVPKKANRDAGRECCRLLGYVSHTNASYLNPSALVICWPQPLTLPGPPHALPSNQQKPISCLWDWNLELPTGFLTDLGYEKLAGSSLPNNSGFQRQLGLQRLSSLSDALYKCIT